MFGSSAAILFDDTAASASIGNNFFTNLFLLLSKSAACCCMGCGEQISELDEKSYQSSVSYIFLIIILYITCWDYWWAKCESSGRYLFGLESSQAFIEDIPQSWTMFILFGNQHVKFMLRHIWNRLRFDLFTYVSNTPNAFNSFEYLLPR